MNRINNGKQSELEQFDIAIETELSEYDSKDNESNFPLLMSVWTQLASFFK